MKDRKEKSRVPILAAGGIVLRNDGDVTPQFAIIQSRKLQTWGLPKGKLAAGEDAMTAARREVLEETGYHVAVHEFLGMLVYETASTRPKVIQFWRMEALDAPADDLMRDVMAVDWLALPDAIGRLSHMRERVFLEQVGPIALKLARPLAGTVPFDGSAGGIVVPGIIVPDVPLVPAAALLSDDGDDVTTEPPVAGGPAPAEHGQAHDPAVQITGHEGLPGKTLMKKTWGWFRHAALLHRQSLER